MGLLMLAKTSLYSVFKDPYFLHRRKNVNIIPIFLCLSTLKIFFFKIFLHQNNNMDFYDFQPLSRPRKNMSNMTDNKGYFAWLPSRPLLPGRRPGA
jgi:hypothetical protein